MSKSQTSKTRLTKPRTGKSSKNGAGKSIWAAGGVLWRHTGGAIEIGLVHRPRYDDWTLPKGKLDRGESLVETAVREIAEETGHRVRLGRHLSTVSYDVPNGRKHVRYWSAEALGGEFAPNHEVDELRWCEIGSASRLLSYRLDQKVLGEFARLPANLATILIVRHARAGRRSRYKGDDALRPLDSTGRKQATALAGLLAAFGVTELHSADRVRCLQTLEPIRQRLQSAIVDEPTLSEESYAADPLAAQHRIETLAHLDDGLVRAVCSQGKVIAPLMHAWAEQDGVRLPAARNRKASVWVICTERGRLVTADHIDSPLPQEI